MQFDVSWCSLMQHDAVWCSSEVTQFYSFFFQARIQVKRIGRCWLKSAKRKITSQYLTWLIRYWIFNDIFLGMWEGHAPSHISPGCCIRFLRSRVMHNCLCTLSSHLVTASTSFIVGSCIFAYAPSRPFCYFVRFLHCRVTRPVTATRTRSPSVISSPRVWLPPSRSPFPKTWVFMGRESGLYPSFVKTKKRKRGSWAR